MSSIDRQHLAALFALVFLTFAVITILAFRRLSAGRRGEFPKDYFKLLRHDPGVQLPVKPEQAARNLINLFEVPVLFYVFVMVAIWTQKTDSTSLGLCWFFVATRYVHSFVQVGSNKIRYRFLAYLIGTSVLFAAWVRLAIQLL